MFLCTGKGEGESEEALWKRAKHKTAVMWEALSREDHKPLDLLVTDKEEACTRKRLAPVSLSYHVQACMRDTEDETLKNCW